MTGTLVFDPLLPLWLIATLGVLVGAGLVLALWRGLSGWGLRALAGAVAPSAQASTSSIRAMRKMRNRVVMVVS